MDGFDNMEQNVVSTADETDKKCSNCGGTLAYDPGSRMLKCPYCESTFDVEETIEEVKEVDFKSEQMKADCNWGEKTKVVICESCGAESVYDELTTSAECPYCGSKQVMEQANDNTIAPGGICPFVIESQKAGANFKTWISRKWFAPNDAKKLAKAEVFKGAYLPFWTFDAIARSNYDGKYGIRHTVRRGDQTHTETRWYSTRGSYIKNFDDKIVLGTNRYSAHLMKGLEPFQTQNSVDYKPEYLAGFAAERYSVGLDAAWEISQKYMESDIRDEVSREIKYKHNADDSKITSLRTIYSDITYKYLLLPVWISHFTYGGKNYQIFVNGQTGKVTGTSPISAFKVAAATIAGLAVAAGLYWFTSN